MAEDTDIESYWEGIRPSREPEPVDPTIKLRAEEQARRMGDALIQDLQEFPSEEDHQDFADGMREFIRELPGDYPGAMTALNAFEETVHARRR